MAEPKKGVGAGGSDPAGDERLSALARAMLGATSEGVLALDLPGRCTFANAAAARMLGYEPEEMLGADAHALIHHARPDGSPYPREACPVRRTILTGAEARVVDEAFWTKDGRPLPVEYASRPLLEGGGISGAVVTFRAVTGRRWQEDAERRAAELDAVIRSIPDAVYIGDENGIRACNDAALEMLGLESLAEMNQNIPVLADRLQNRFFRTGERIPPEEEPFVRALRGETVVEEVLSRHLKAGRDVIVRCAAAPIRYGGSILGAVAVNTDITERKRSEEELRQSEVFIRSTLNSLSAHIAILDETGLILATNRAWRGFAEANPPIAANTGTGTNYLAVCDAATGEGSGEAASFARGIRDVISGRRDSFELEYPCHSPTERRWFVGRVTRFPDTSPPKAVVAHENVTERKLVMEEVELRARQQEAVADLGRKALAEPDLLVVMNDAVEIVARILGVEYAKVAELLPDGGGLLLRAGVGWREGLIGNAVEETGIGSQAGYTLLTDAPVVLEDLSEEDRFDRPPLLEEHGVVSGMSAVIRGREGPFGVLAAHTTSRRAFTENDVNFLRAIANVLGEAIEWRKAEAGMVRIREAERSRMARDLHDGPLQDLTYALTAAQLVQSNSEDPGLQRWLDRTVEALKRTGRELRAAVHDLRLEEQRGRPLPEMVRSLVELNRRMTPETDVRLDVAEGFPDSPLGEDDTELLRIIQEALSNTRRHSRARNVVVSLGADGGGVWAEVTDDGRGFGPEEGPEHGPGVGLESMRERAQALGGNLDVESEPGKGTRVRFARNVGAEDAGGAAEPEGEARVLLVEDHAAVREAIAASFEREAGFRISGQAGSLAEARELISGGLLMVDVAVVDLGLPDGYGGDLIRDLGETNPGARALVLSATLDRAELARAVEAGAAGVIHKSAGMDEVLGAVRRLLADEKLMPLHEVVELLRLAVSRRDEDLDARRAIARLTPREREILDALADGLEGKEIARRLRISAKTERNHVASIMTKLGVHSRLQSLVFALRHGAAHVRQTPKRARQSGSSGTVDEHDRGGGSRQGT